ncbi:MAG TPA: hypothetical protein VKQ70_17325 [Caulobacteraceae bacterium]|jgi:Spy/CpxP family protein refolding chaperone|nr:hypothetical protein [Caulobacteraceae bacterium]
MTRILLAALASASLASAAATPTLAAEIDHGGPARMHKPAHVNRMAAHHHPIHCTIRHHHRICR